MPAAEAELVAAARRGGVRERQQLVQKFRPLIARSARRYRRSSRIDPDELMQEGYVGLLRALRHYDPALGVPFGAYARWWVFRAMQQLVCELSGPVVLSDRAVRQLVRVKRAERQYEQGEKHGARASELAAVCGLPRALVESLIAADRAARTLSVIGVEDDRERLDGGQTLVDPLGEEAYESTIWRLAAAQLPSMLARLGERERRVVRARYGIDCVQRTLGELALELRVSAERVRQIEQAALRKLSAMCDSGPQRRRCA